MRNFFQWFGDKFFAGVKKEQIRRLYILGEQMMWKVRRNISIPSVPERSKPGEFPHMETEKLKRSIYFEVNQQTMKVIVGTNLLYGLWLEKGTKGGTIIKPKKGKYLSWINEHGRRIFVTQVVMKPLAARPFISRTFREEQALFKRIMLGR